MNEDEMIRKMGLGAWIKHQNSAKTTVSLSIANEDKVLAGIKPTGIGDPSTVLEYMTPDEAEAFGLRLVAAAGIVRARQATKEPNNECG